MKTTRHMLMTAALAVAFLSAGAFAQTPAISGSQTGLHVTVIAKTSSSSFAS
jgi:opacity protein-like surface antigen